MNEIALPRHVSATSLRVTLTRQPENAVGAVGEWRDRPAAAFVRLPGHCRPESLCVRGATLSRRR